MDGDAFGAAVTLSAKVGDDGEQVVHRFVFVLALGGFVPAGEFAAAADVGQHKGVALFQPMLANRAHVVRQLGHVKPAVHINQRGRFRLPWLFAHPVIRDGRAIGGGGVVLFYGDAFGVELGDLAAHHAQFHHA